MELISIQPIQTTATTYSRAPRYLAAMLGLVATAFGVSASAGVLYDQMDNTSGYYLNSQNVDPAHDQYDTLIADDFSVPSNATWFVDGIDVAAGLSGSGTPDSFNVYFYTDASGLPGNLVASRLAQTYTNISDPSISFDDLVALPSGNHYWVAVQANMSSGQGTWAWESRSVQSGDFAVFRNPADGYGTGCTTWTKESSCLALTGPDTGFRLNGTTDDWVVTTTADDAVGVACNGDHTCNTLRDAIFSAADGDTIVFNLPSLPATITLTNGGQLNLQGKGITIHGPGFKQLSISGSGDRVFLLPNYAVDVPAATIDHLTINNGIMHGDNGLAGSAGTMPGAAGTNGNAGDSIGGGCILVGAHNGLHLNFDLVTGCIALGGAGGSGGNGAQGAAGTNNNQEAQAGGVGGNGGNGGVGGTGGSGLGGAIAAFGTLYLDSTTISDSYAAAGPGGNGGVGGKGGTGGHGGPSSCVPVTPSGPCLPINNGGDGGVGGDGGNGGIGGAMGKSAGGAIYAPGPGLVTITNSTLVDNQAISGFFGTTAGDGGTYGAAGDGGVAGDGGAIGATGNAGVGGIGGYGGYAEGGAIYNTNTQAVTLLLHSTLAFNTVYNGVGGLGSNGSANGGVGFAGGGGIMNEGGTLSTVQNSIIASNFRVDVDGNPHNYNCHWNEHPTLVGNNLSDDAPGTSCFFDMHGDPKFAAPKNGKDAYSWGGNDLPVLMLGPGSPAIGGAHPRGPGPLPQTDGCAAIANDERGIPRPHGSVVFHNGIGVYHAAACDLGAVESGNDIIFINGFDNSL